MCDKQFKFLPRVQIYLNSIGRWISQRIWSEKVMGDDSAEIEPGLLGTSDIYNVKIFSHAATTSVKIGCLYQFFNVS